MKDTKTDVYGSLAIAGLGGVVILIEKLMPYKEEDDEGLPPLPAKAVIVGDPLRRILAELKLPFGFIYFPFSTFIMRALFDALVK